jgi:hypothetical protein
VVSGRGTFWMSDPADVKEFRPGQLLFFKRGAVHAILDILETPLVFLSVDAPRRDPSDIVVVNPEDGTPEAFIRGRGLCPASRYSLHVAADAGDGTSMGGEDRRPTFARSTSRTRSGPRTGWTRYPAGPAPPGERSADACGRVPARAESRR